MSEETIVVLRQSEYNRMCKIQQDMYRTCVVPDDFDEYNDIPLTMAMCFEYQFWRSVEQNMIEEIKRRFADKLSCC